MSVERYVRYSYCPKCGSETCEVGQFDIDGAIVHCRECKQMFTIEFIKRKYFCKCGEEVQQS